MLSIVNTLQVFKAVADTADAFFCLQAAALHLSGIIGHQFGSTFQVTICIRFGIGETVLL